MHSFQFHALPVLGAAVIQWLIGAFWYGVMFKKSWKALVGGAEGKASGAAFGMIASFVASVILSFVLVNVLGWAGTATFMAGAALAIVCWLGFMAPPLFAQHIYEHRPVNLFAINAGYWIVAMAVSGGVLAIWR